MSDRVIVRIDDAQVAHVTLNRADVHNAFDPEMVEALTSAFANWRHSNTPGARGKSVQRFLGALVLSATWTPPGVPK